MCEDERPARRQAEIRWAKATHLRVAQFATLIADLWPYVRPEYRATILGILAPIVRVDGDSDQ